MTNKIYLPKTEQSSKRCRIFHGPLEPNVPYIQINKRNNNKKTRGDNGVDSSTANITLGIDISLSTEADKCCRQINARPAGFLFTRLSLARAFVVLDV